MGMGIVVIIIAHLLALVAPGWVEDPHKRKWCLRALMGFDLIWFYVYASFYTKGEIDQNDFFIIIVLMAVLFLIVLWRVDARVRHARKNSTVHTTGMPRR